ncbi:uncharacterized protein A4U43_C05F7020 [Asparagus officinalis]|uniref:Uncharacterized protein n=1 Tax=Asparagus officinalis TaxID=4686 RepID=A0A5P1EQX9_ASPOF|nr:uncharacterized protein A4U43_C05F7020 [Asparagus officinalis]
MEGVVGVDIVVGIDKGFVVGLEENRGFAIELKDAVELEEKRGFTVELEDALKLKENRGFVVELEENRGGGMVEMVETRIHRNCRATVKSIGHMFLISERLRGNLGKGFDVCTSRGIKTTYVDDHDASVQDGHEIMVTE